MLFSSLVALPQQSAPIASFLVTCICSDDIVSDICTVEIFGATVPHVVIGNGQGKNQPLPLGAHSTLVQLFLAMQQVTVAQLRTVTRFQMCFLSTTSYKSNKV